MKEARKDPSGRSEGSKERKKVGRILLGGVKEERSEA